MINIDILAPDNVESLITFYSLTVRKAKEQRTLARQEWKSIRDRLTLEENAEYLDRFREFDDQIRRAEINLNSFEGHILANCN